MANKLNNKKLEGWNDPSNNLSSPNSISPKLPDKSANSVNQEHVERKEFDEKLNRVVNTLGGITTALGIVDGRLKENDLKIDVVLELLSGDELEKDQNIKKKIIKESLEYFIHKEDYKDLDNARNYIKEFRNIIPTLYLDKKIKLRLLEIIGGNWKEYEDGSKKVFKNPLLLKKLRNLIDIILVYEPNEIILIETADGDFKFSVKSEQPPESLLPAIPAATIGALGVAADTTPATAEPASTMKNTPKIPEPNEEYYLTKEYFNGTTCICQRQKGVRSMQCKAVCKPDIERTRKREHCSREDARKKVFGKYKK